MSLFLKPLELGYRGVAGSIRRLYRAGLLKPKRLARPVISIGNISFGGSGKTPVTIAVAEHLRTRGVRVAVLTRGYKRNTGEIEIVSGKDPARFGDEPVVIAQRLPGVPVIVGTDRYTAGGQFLERDDCEVFVLDDGFQHHRLFRDLDVVIDDPEAQLLRESRSALHDADVILAREGSPTPTEFRLDLEPLAVVTGDRVEPLETLRGRRAVAFAGLASNHRFFELCRRLGVELAATRGFPDHHRYSEADLEMLRTTAKATLSMLLTTEKDAVKIPEPVSFIRVEARITPQNAFFARITSVLRDMER